jgi:hypothetical protein
MSLTDINTITNNNEKKDYVAINIKDSSVSYPPNSKLFCNLCSCNLVLLDAQKEEWYCNRCSISYFPNKGEKVKRANKFVTPGPATDEHGNITGVKRPIFAMVKDDVELSSGYKKTKLPKSFAEMESRGVKITSYTTTEG